MPEHPSRAAVLGKLSAALAHELNQPLASMLNNAQAARRFLQQQPADLQEVRQSLDDIIAEGRRAGEVIHRLRLLFVDGTPSRHRLRLTDVVREVLALKRADLAESRIEPTLRLDEEICEIWANRVQLQQVLLNLVTNACEALHGGSMERPRLEIAVTRHLDCMHLVVSDNGPGIAPILLGQIFEAFFTTKAQGTGLGLAICSAIVRQHGGHIEVANNSEGGARFTVVLPTGTAAQQYS